MVEVEDVFPLEIVGFIIVLLVVWTANGCRPLFPDADSDSVMVYFIAVGGLMLGFGLLLALFVAEVANYIQRSRGK